MAKRSPIHREGFGIILAFLLSGLTVTVLAVAGIGGWVTLSLSATMALLTLFSLYFFRDPDRRIPDDAGAVLAPADGKVVEVEETRESVFLKEKTLKIGIFLNVFDVHVNRSPVGGVVRFFEYRRGRFLRANLAEASAQNEQTVIGVDVGGVVVVFKQIAGLIARRISCELREGHNVNAGERIGIIKFGSRMDVFLPLDTDVRVERGQRVVAGETIIGVLKHVS